jgi:hypothetical protein
MEWITMFDNIIELPSPAPEAGRDAARQAFDTLAVHLARTGEALHNILMTEAWRDLGYEALNDACEASEDIGVGNTLRRWREVITALEGALMADAGITSAVTCAPHGDELCDDCQAEDDGPSDVRALYHTLAVAVEELADYSPAEQAELCAGIGGAHFAIQRALSFRLAVARDVLDRRDD